MIKINGVQQQEHSLQVQWADGKKSDYDYLWLRDNCPSAFHPKTKERNFNLLSVPEDIHPVAVNLTDDSLVINWQPPPHVSIYAYEWLYQNDYNRSSSAVFADKLAVQPWDKHYGDAMVKARYQDIMDDDAALLNWLVKLQNIGLSVIIDMPEDGLEKSARRIAHLRETNFGVTFEVVSKPNPNNQAYTAEALPLHTDLPNQELPPGIQFLHCISNEAPGGESRFVDGFAVAEYIRRHDAEAFKLLSEQMIPYRFYDATHDLYEEKPVIVLSQGEISEINYNAHICGVFQLSQAAMRPYYRAYRLFMKTIANDNFVVQFKLSNGEMAVFDNRRVLHGRAAFNPQTGFRRLRGCYIDRGDLKSKIRVLQRQHKQ